MILKERWRPISRYEGLYEASDRGQVRSLDTIDSMGRHRFGRVRKQSALVRDGVLECMQVTLSNKGIKMTHPVHRLVLEAFVGPAPEGMECCHRDGNAANNVLSNLYWGTHTQNMRDCVNHGRAHMSAGVSHPGAKLTPDLVRYIRDSTKSQRELSRELGVSQTQVGRVRRGELWKHLA